MIPPDIMRELRDLEVSTVKAVRNARIGPHTSRARGPGFDFDQHLPYRPGDDVRRIDWNATARLQTPHVRLTHAERELDLVMAIDLSRSMEVGTSRYSKRDVVAFISAALLFTASADHINAGFLAFSDQVLEWSPPRRASGAAWRVLEEICSLQPRDSRTRLLPAIRHLLSRLRAMSVVTLISDFFTHEEVLGSVELRTLAVKHDVIAVMIEDPADTALPSGRGFVRVRDVETHTDRVIALNPHNRRAYADAAARRRAAISAACYRMGIDFVVVRTDAPVMLPLIELFARRKHA